MADNTGNLPPAGWHPDPSDAGMERWWSGAEWTSYTRSEVTSEAPFLAAPIEPVFASANASPFGNGGSASPQPVTNSMFENYVEERSIEQDKVSASWYDPTFRDMLQPPQRNGKATAALVLGIISFLTAPLSLITLVLTLVFSSLALKAARLSELSEKRPVGRARAQWAVFFAVLTMLWTGVASYFIYTQYQGVLF